MTNKLTALCGSIFLLGAITVNCALAQGNNDGGGRLAGTWDAEVTIVNCQTGAAITGFRSTASFNQGGTYVGITGGTSPAERSPELGVWRHLNGNRYQFRFKAYHAPGGGVPVFYDIVTHEIRLDRDNLNYTSAGTSVRYSMSGDLIFSGCSTAVGSRFTLE